MKTNINRVIILTVIMLLIFTNLVYATGAKNLEANFAIELATNTASDIINQTGQPEDIEEDWASSAAKFLSQPWVNTLLLVVGFVCLVIEFLIPGFGIPGLLGLISIFLFFASNLAVGNSSIASIICFVIGTILIVIEIFIPGFGLPGISGILLTLFGLATTMQSIEQAFTAILMALIVAFATGFLIIKYGLNSRTFKKITLDKSIKSSSNPEYKDEKLVKIGDVGKSLTNMRPYGFVQINGEKYDATAESNFINKDQTIEVIKINGNKIFVKESI